LSHAPPKAKYDFKNMPCHNLPKANHEPLCGACAKDHDSLYESCLKINNKDHLKSHNSRYIYSTINILDIPNDVVGIIITFIDIIGKHVFRFINKHFHNIVHSVIGSKLLLPKEFHKYAYDRIAAGVGDILLFDWVMKIFGKNEYLQSNDFEIADITEIAIANDFDIIAIATRAGNLNFMRHIKKYYNYKWDERTCSSAAEGGHLELLKWLKKNGCPWNSHTCVVAAENGRVSAAR
jgi:hypothetical protein